MRNEVAQRRAISLRKQATDAERHLWRYLRQRQLNNFRFRRQVPIGPFIADFVCLEAWLIVEVDGGQHQNSDLDRDRDSYLSRRGFRVLRFWNNEILQQTEAVLEVILRSLQAFSPPS